MRAWIKLTGAKSVTRSGLKTHVGGVCNLLSLLRYRQFRHGIAESSSVVRPGGKTHGYGRFRQVIPGSSFRNLERSIRVICKRWCHNSMPGVMSDSVGAFWNWKLRILAYGFLKIVDVLIRKSSVEVLKLGLFPNQESQLFLLMAV